MNQTQINYFFGKTKGMVELVNNIYTDFSTKVLPYLTVPSAVQSGRESYEFFKSIYPKILKNITIGDFFQKNGELSDDEINLFLAEYKEYIPQINLKQSLVIQPFINNKSKLECFERQMREDSARDWSTAHWRNDLIRCEGDFNEIKKEFEKMKPYVELCYFIPSVFYVISTILTEIKQHRDLYYLPRYRPLFTGDEDEEHKDEDEEHKQNRIANYQKRIAVNQRWLAYYQNRLAEEYQTMKKYTNDHQGRYISDYLKKIIAEDQKRVAEDQKSIAEYQKLIADDEETLQRLYATPAQPSRPTLSDQTDYPLAEKQKMKTEDDARRQSLYAKLAQPGAREPGARESAANDAASDAAKT